MADFVEALGAALAARYRWAGAPKLPATHRTGLKSRMNRIAKAVGGDRRAVARAAGVPYSTWGAWLTGKRLPSARNLGKLEAAFSRIVAAPAMAAVVARKGYPTIWGITAVVVADPDGTRYVNRKTDGPSNAEGYRTFNAEDIDGEPVVDAWLGSGDDEAAAELGRQIADEYSGEFGFEGDDVEVTLHD